MNGLGFTLAVIAVVLLGKLHELPWLRFALVTLAMVGMLHTFAVKKAWQVEEECAARTSLRRVIYPMNGMRCTCDLTDEAGTYDCVCVSDAVPQAPARRGS